MRNRTSIACVVVMLTLMTVDARVALGVPCCGPGSGADTSPWQELPQISNYSCKPEAAQSVARVQKIEKKLSSLRAFLQRHRNFLEQKNTTPFYFFFIAVAPIKKAYQTHGEKKLNRGFFAESFFEKSISWEVLRPKLDAHLGRWITRGEAYNYLISQTGIPRSFATKDFFGDVWGSAARHTASLLLRFETNEITPLKNQRGDIISSLTASGHCTLGKRQGSSNDAGDCDQRLKNAKKRMTESIKKADALLEDLIKSPESASSKKVVRSISAFIKKWSTMASKERKECPEAAKYIDNASRKWNNKFKAEFTRLLRKSFR